MEGVRAVGAQIFETRRRVSLQIVGRFGETSLPGRDSFGKIDMERLFHFQRAEG